MTAAGFPENAEVVKESTVNYSQYRGISRGHIFQFVFGIGHLRSCFLSADVDRFKIFRAGMSHRRPPIGSTTSGI